MTSERSEHFHLRLEAILDLMEDGIYLSDRHGMTVWVNKAYERLTGLPREHFKGRNVRRLVEDGLFNRVLNPQIVKSKKSASTVQELGPDKKTVLLRGFPILDENGDVDLVISFARDISAITQLREQIAEQRGIIEQYHGRMAHILEQQNSGDALFASPVMRGLLQSLARVAETDATVLLLGETGVGKDVLARLAHSQSPRKDKMFMKVDCASIAESLIESELFGYVRGAFSGAGSEGRAGYFEIADGGTVFLDEIGELPLPMQSKLLRILQDKEFMRVGSTRVQKVDVRIVAATNRDLAEDIKRGTFRSDLYYRLNVARISIPPLRERREEVPILAQHFLDLYNHKYRKHMHLSARASEALTVHNWPGNIRELENMMLHLVITNEGELIDVQDLPTRVRENAPAPLSKARTPQSARPRLPDSPRPLRKIMADMEAELLREALEHLGSVNKVAEFFGINRSTIFRKLHPEREPGV